MRVSADRGSAALTPTLSPRERGSAAPDEGSSGRRAVPGEDPGVASEAGRMRALVISAQEEIQSRCKDWMPAFERVKELALSLGL
jgi:hypothetical protein